MVNVQTIGLDSQAFARIDLIKMDIEGMEIEAVEGAKACLAKFRPMLVMEIIKTDKAGLRYLLEKLEYSVFESGMNILAVHRSDSSLKHVNADG
jgi:hypothetical protein